MPWGRYASLKIDRKMRVLGVVTRAKRWWGAEKEKKKECGGPDGKFGVCKPRISWCIMRAFVPTSCTLYLFFVRGGQANLQSPEISLLRQALYRDISCGG